MTKIQTMHSRVRQDSLRHTLESNRHLWNPMGDLGPFFVILDLRYYWTTGLFRNPTLTTWGSYWTLSGLGPFVFVYLCICHVLVFLLTETYPGSFGTSSVSPSTAITELSILPKAKSCCKITRDLQKSSQELSKVTNKGHRKRWFSCTKLLSSFRLRLSTSISLSYACCVSPPFLSSLLSSFSSNWGTRFSNL